MESRAVTGTLPELQIGTTLVTAWPTVQDRVTACTTDTRGPGDTRKEKNGFLLCNADLYKVVVHELARHY